MYFNEFTAYVPDFCFLHIFILKAACFCSIYLLCWGCWRAGAEGEHVRGGRKEVHGVVVSCKASLWRGCVDCPWQYCMVCVGAVLIICCLVVGSVMRRLNVEVRRVTGMWRVGWGGVEYGVVPDGMRVCGVWWIVGEEEIVWTVECVEEHWVLCHNYEYNVML